MMYGIAMTPDEGLIAVTVLAVAVLAVAYLTPGPLEMCAKCWGDPSECICEQIDGEARLEAGE